MTEPLFDAIRNGLDQGYAEVLRRIDAAEAAYSEIAKCKFFVESQDGHPGWIDGADFVPLLTRLRGDLALGENAIDELVGENERIRAHVAELEDARIADRCRIAELEAMVGDAEWFFGKVAHDAMGYTVGYSGTVGWGETAWEALRMARTSGGRGERPESERP